MQNLLNLSYEKASNYALHHNHTDSIKQPSDYDIAFIDFYFFKTYHLRDNREAFKIINKICANRLKKYIRKHKPDKIFVFDDRTASILLGKKEIYHRWKYELDANGYTCPLYFSIDFMKLIPEEGKEREYTNTSNLTNYIADNMVSLWLDKVPYSLKNIKPNYVYVDTMKKFKHMMKKLYAAEGPIAVDTETKDLTVVTNRVLLIQFAISENKGYVLPYMAKYSPFSSFELKKIEKRLHNFFSLENINKEKYLIMHGAKFDIPVIRHVFKVPYLHWKVWDTIAGEVALDENLVLLRKKFGIKSWSLDEVFKRYNNDFYYKASFSKSDRNRMDNVGSSKALFEYASMDVQCLIGIHKMQLEKAGDIPYRGIFYVNHYKRFVLEQMDAMVQVISEMIYRGNPLDMSWLFKLYSNESPIKKLREKIVKDLYQKESVKKANKILLEKEGIPTKGLFNNQTSWAFNIEKSEHRKLLYFDVLQLIPISYGKWKNKKGSTKKYREPSLDKKFQGRYMDVKEVGILNRLNELKTLYGTFCKGIYIKAVNDPDIKYDMCLRPKYGYEDVVTGRSNSYNPSLQQIPEKKKEAKLIKRMFITPPGMMYIKLDYSTHEIRGWGIVSGDLALSSLFRKAKEYILQFRRNPTEQNKHDMETKGDAHKLNYSLFTGTKVEEVTDQQRKESKGLGFGTIYGMGDETMSQRIGKSEEYTRRIKKKFFSKYVKAANWLRLMREFSEKNLYAYSLLGRVRNLSGYLLDNSYISSALGRKADNSPIQGFCSDIAYYAAKLIMKHFYLYYKHKNEIPYNGQLKAGVVQQVHDALKFIVPCEDFIPLLRIIEYCSTIGTMKSIEEKFKIKFTTEIAVDFEIGATGDTLQKWDWSEASMWKCIKHGLEIQKEKLGYPININKIFRRMYNEAKQNEKFLLEHYPLDIDKYRDVIVENPLS